LVPEPAKPASAKPSGTNARKIPKSFMERKTDISEKIKIQRKIIRLTPALFVIAVFELELPASFNHFIRIAANHETKPFASAEKNFIVGARLP